MKRRDFIKSSGAALAAAPFMNFGAGNPLGKKMLVLGFDGMDPGIVNRLMGQGQLPNMQRLGEQGIFTMMRSTIPPQSPVAWGSFISGADPGVFGIFDFLHRDPETYIPMFSQSDTLPSRCWSSSGKYQIPLKPGKVVLKREGPAFWDYLEERDIPATLVKLPTNYPPSASGQRTLSGMGTPGHPGHLRHLLAVYFRRERIAERPVGHQRLLRLHRREQRHGRADRGPEERPGQGRRGRRGAVQGLCRQPAQDGAHRHPGQGNPDRRKGILRLGGDRVLPDQPPGQHHRHGQVLPDGNGRALPPLHLPHPCQPAQPRRAHQHPGRLQPRAGRPCRPVPHHRPAGRHQGPEQRHLLHGKLHHPVAVGFRAKAAACSTTSCSASAARKRGCSSSTSPPWTRGSTCSGR